MNAIVKGSLKAQYRLALGNLSGATDNPRPIGCVGDQDGGQSNRDRPQALNAISGWRTHKRCQTK